MDVELERLLTKAGWFPEWSYDVESTARKIKSYYGIEISEVAREFLQRFGGLSLADKDGRRAYLSPLRIKRVIPREGLSEEDGLYPLGDINGGWGFLMMDQNGRVWFYWEGEPEHFADAPEEALRKCCTQQL